MTFPNPKDEAKPPSPQAPSGAISPDIARLLDILARIEQRRQMQHQATVLQEVR